MLQPIPLAAQLAKLLKHHNYLLAVAESCTGGGLTATLTSVPGSSAWFDRGFITYSNSAKHDMLGVPESTLLHEGAVSEATARTMAEGCLLHSAADLSVAITGIAGPDGGSQAKPVGTVWIACAGARQKTIATCYYFEGDRERIRKAAEIKALEMLISRVHAILPQESISKSTYFFALMPDIATALAIQDRARALIKHVSCGPTSLEKLHLTLTYLGKLHVSELNHIKNIPWPCRVAPFKLHLTHAGYSHKLGVTYATPNTPSKPLKQLYACLAQHMLQQGFKPERDAFFPHITLAHHHTHHRLEPQRIETIPWFIHEVCLVQSTQTTQGPSHYNVIQRWSLHESHFI